VTLRHYGPVAWGSGAKPVTVEYGFANYPNVPTTWYDITHDFAVASYNPSAPR
jgi:hypothetical protein